MERIALFPGTFDPITIGHMDIIHRALPLFDKLIIGIGRNVNKSAMFSEEQRFKWITEIFSDTPIVSVVLYEGLTVECCKRVGANFILRVHPRFLYPTHVYWRRDAVAALCR